MILRRLSPEARLDLNIPLFIGYRVFFNLRFYYPVFALFYLDVGMTLEQFGTLQALWALSIVLFEVPSGIIADLIGRRKTLRLGAFLAVLEMLIFAMASGFWGFAINRVLSGFNESLVSGADSALLYDSLKARHREEEYKEILGKAQFCLLIMGAISAISGSYLYTFHIRLPIWVTAVCMVITFVFSLMLFEYSRESKAVTLQSQWLVLTRSVADILANQQLIFLILLIFVVDTSVRLALVHSSLYYQNILIPVAWFGVIGVGVRLITSVISRYAYRIDRRFGFGKSTSAFMVLLLVGFTGLTLTIPYYGVIFVPMLTSGMVFISLNLEGEFNRRIGSERRATLLSIKNICVNIGFGLGMPTFALIAKTRLADGFLYLTGAFVCGAIMLLWLGWRVWRRPNQ